VALTAVVMLAWYLISKSRDKETAHLLHLRYAELRKALVDEEEMGKVSTKSTAFAAAEKDAGVGAGPQKRFVSWN